MSDEFHTSRQTQASPLPPRQRLRTVFALLLGFVAVFVLSVGTDQLFHVLEVYPPWGQPMNEPGLLLLALSYRCAYGALGSFIAARLAPYAPMRHAILLGVIGLPLTAAGVVAAIQINLGPVWYPVALFVTVLPCAWLGGVLDRATEESWRRSTSQKSSR